MSEEVIELDLAPYHILHFPLYNKGTAFTKEERTSLGLHGLLPNHVSTIDEQFKRYYDNFCKKRTPLGKYTSLMDLMNRNEILFYMLVEKYLEEMFPLIYTPTVGEAAQRYSRIFYSERGLYLSYPNRKEMAKIFKNAPKEDIDVIVVTDGERILGLGDLGIGGMAIPVGKLILYTLFGGFHPSRCLPIYLDVGTNNEDLLEDQLYLGWHHKRISDEKYYPFIDEFVQTVKKSYPNAILQWEDFGRSHARPLLEKYREKIPSFNDDIQGTAAVTLGAVFAAVRQKKEELKEQKIIVYGGGSAGIGVTYGLFYALMDEGLSEEEAKEKIFVIDINGLIHTQMQEILDFQKPFAQNTERLKEWKYSNAEYISLLDVVRNLHPDILIGVSTHTGAFSQEVVEEMYTHQKKPIIFPLSNPTSKSEAFPKEVLQWTEGNAIIATGSPFSPVDFKGKIHEIAQCNNVYIFPGVGLGTIISKAEQITVGMFLEAARVLAKSSPSLKDNSKSLFPSIREVRNVSKKIALAVAKQAVKEKVSSATIEDIQKALKEKMWKPQYAKFRKKSSKN